MCRAYQYQKIARTTSTHTQNALGICTSVGFNFSVNCGDARFGRKHRK